MDRVRVIRFLNAAMALTLMGVMLAAFYQQLAHHMIPCPLCYLQRFGMVSVSLGNLMNLRFGVKMRYYAFSLLSSFFGAAIALYQISLHICPEFRTFGYPVFGLGLYTWAFLSFCCSILAITFFLFFHTKEMGEKKKLHWFEVGTFLIVLSVILLNCIDAAYHCKWGFCRGCGF